MPALQSSFLPPDIKTEETITPLMAQYLSIKGRHQDCLVFFRLGDFYELFFEDAIKASKALDIALTRRGQHLGEDIPMCGVPAHAYENYLAKLIRKGFRVAICEQQEKPEDAKRRGGKSIVQRDVVRIITPGTITEESLLDARASNYLACLASINNEMALAWCDIVTGLTFAQNVSIADLAAALARVDAKEILLSQHIYENPQIGDLLAPWRSQLAVQPNGRFDHENARRRLINIYQIVDLASFGDFSRGEITALGSLLEYVALTQKTELRHFSPPVRESSPHLSIDAATRRNLELVRTLTGEREGSLLNAIDRTESGGGARLLAERLASPSTNADEISERLDALSFFVGNGGLREHARAALRHAPDSERALARLALGRGGPRDLAVIRVALLQAQKIRDTLAPAANLPTNLRREMEQLGEHHHLVSELGRALMPELPMMARDGNFIAREYHPPLDELLTLRDDGRRLIAALQESYATECAIPSLKIKHNQIIGYHIEVTPSQSEKLLNDKEKFIHRQTLVNAARFTTVELSEMEQNITRSADRALALELELFEKLVHTVLGHMEKIRAASQALASLDVYSSLAELAVEQNYVRPNVDNSLSFKIIGGRHPVVEQILRRNSSSHSFIANDCDLARSQHLWLLTGPNMAGKSTFLRQNALIVILAQMGSYVPADTADIGVVDRLYSRVGAADDLAAGRSTFMVEMVETAAILNQSGERSLVILDEIGRGTSTFDGLSIAWAVLEHLHEFNRCRALFATHYHELTLLDKTLPCLRTATMRIKEWENKIVFLHEVIEGMADRSYGIHVAQMAGLPDWAIARAGQVLSSLEDQNSSVVRLENSLPAMEVDHLQDTAKHFMSSELEQLLLTLRPDELTPREALESLYKIKAAM